MEHTQIITDLTTSISDKLSLLAVAVFIDFTRIKSKILKIEEKIDDNIGRIASEETDGRSDTKKAA